MKTTLSAKVPVNWNGGLVVFAHGYQDWGEGIGSLHYEPRGGHLAEHGYASAASGYRDRASEGFDGHRKS